MTSANDSASLTDSAVVRVSQAAPGFLRAVVDNPPINLFDPTVFAGLNLLQSYVDEPANTVKVVVFESANPDFFFAHLDLAKAAEVPDIPGARNIVQSWPGFSQWLTNTPVVTVAKIRGRARGIGNEFICACDMRFASSERARLCQIEVGFGLVPGGGGLEWLPRHIGRGRALEAVLSADDFDADTAERYGWVNRALPDAELDDYVDRLARRIATFDATAIATAKQLIGQRQPTPAEAELAESFGAIRALRRGEPAQRIAVQLRERAADPWHQLSSTCRSSTGSDLNGQYTRPIGPDADRDRRRRLAGKTPNRHRNHLHRKPNLRPRAVHIRQPIRRHRQSMPGKNSWCRQLESWLPIWLPRA